MKKLHFLTSIVIIFPVVYAIPDLLFGVNVAKATSITVVEDLAAGNDDTCNVGYLRYDIIPGGIRLCKKMTTVEYTPGTTQATVVDDIKTIDWNYEELAAMGMQFIYPNNMSDTVRRQNNINIMQAICSTLGSGWTPYSLDFPAFDSSSGNIRCKHLTTISYTPGATNRTIVTGAALFPEYDVGTPGCRRDLNDLGFYGSANGVTWGWSGANVLFCKTQETLFLGTQTEQGYACTLMSGTFTTPYTTGAFTLPVGTYTGTSPVSPTIWSGQLGGSYSSQTLSTVGTYTGTNSAGCSWDIIINSPSQTNGPGCTSVPPIGSSFPAPYSFNFNIVDGNYYGNNAGVTYGGDGPPDYQYRRVYLKTDGAPKYPYDIGSVVKDSFNQPFSPGHYTGALNGDTNSCHWDFTVTPAQVSGSCSSPATHYSCASGTSQNNSETSTAYSWICAGANGGISMSCSESKPPVCSSNHYTCVSGLSDNNVDGLSFYSWDCKLGNIHSSCFESKSVSTLPQDGVCATEPNYCQFGTSIDEEDTSSEFRWACIGEYNRATDHCSKLKVPPGDVNGSCSAIKYNCTIGSLANRNETSSAYTWLCAGSGNGTTAKCSLLKPPTATLSATPDTIDAGQSSKITWSSTNATNCTAMGGFLTGGAVSNSTGVSVSPANTSQYQISCTGVGGTVGSNVVTVTVLHPTCSISATPNRVVIGNPTTVSWSSHDVYSWVIRKNDVRVSWGNTPSGSYQDPISTQTTYSISCLANGNPITASTQVVNVVPSFNEF